MKPQANNPQARFMKIPLVPKELSWLSFNKCVLEEAGDESVPLLERLRFLGIYSSNLDEFFRIRVAALRQLASFKKKGKETFGFDPHLILESLNGVIIGQNERFNGAYDQIVRRLNREGIFILDEKTCAADQGAYIRDYFHRKVHHRLHPILINRHKEFPVMKDKSIYLFIVMGKIETAAKNRLALIEVPTPLLSRFLILPEHEGRSFVILLDDVIRYCLQDVFSMFDFNHFSAYTVKLTRDAELDIDVDFSESLIKKISKSLSKRKKGVPVRFVYAADLPAAYLDLIVSKLHLKRDESIIPGGRYHNFRDFIAFPNLGRPALEYPAFTPVAHSGLAARRTIIAVIKRNDILFHYPYNSFNHFIDFLREAAIDPKVRSVKITIYRAAKNSSVLNALINAAKNGKAVTVIVELQARFDEEANINWANRLKEEGVFVNYGVPGLKVHAKLCLVSRKENGSVMYFAAVSTGNFNEDTARVYTDHCLLTADQRIAGEVKRLFDYLESMYKLKRFEHLIVSPFGVRERFLELIDAEIRHAGTPGGGKIVIKINNLTDEKIIQKLYEAAAAGVRVRLIVRGMNSLVADVPDAGGRICVTRIVDRFLEHTRILYFHNGGDELFFISSADLMQRNLDKRVEVVCPIYHRGVKEELRRVMDITQNDTVKARRVGCTDALPAVLPVPPRPGLRSQVETARFIEELNRTRGRKGKKRK
jgi:polyphosphate kinase